MPQTDTAELKSVVQGYCFVKQNLTGLENKTELELL